MRIFRPLWLFAALLFAIFIMVGVHVAPAFAVPNSKVLTPERAIATWPLGIPAGEKRPVIVFLPGWGGVGAVNAVVSAHNLSLVTEGYVTLAIGFETSSLWISDIDVKTKEGLNKLCADATIPANCNAIVLDGGSYGGIQNDLVIRYLRGSGYDGGVGSTGKAIGFVSEDAGYVPPGVWPGGRTGLADTSFYSVAMIENLGDATFDPDTCDVWGNCGARILGNAHRARGDSNVFSICPVNGSHGDHISYADWDAWVISAIKTMIHIKGGIPLFTGYTNPTLAVDNACVSTNVLPGLSVSGADIVANGQPVQLHGVNMCATFRDRNVNWYPYITPDDYVAVSRDWRATAVRISIYPTQWKNTDGNTPEAILMAGLANEVNAALDNGMYAVISYHVVGWPDGWYDAPSCCECPLGGPYNGCNPPDFYDSSMVWATSFWTKMAQTYGADKRIIFDLWNEPAFGDPNQKGVHAASNDCNDVFPASKWALLKPHYDSLIQTVRNNGAQNIVLATGNCWASWLVGIRNNLLADPNVVYAYHRYSDEGNNTTAKWNTDMDGLTGVKPVMVSEWGFSAADALHPVWPGTQLSYGDLFTEWMDANNLSSLAWSYHWENAPALLFGDMSLTLYGIFAKNYINSPLKAGPVVAAITPTKRTKPTWMWTSGGGGNGTYRYKFNNADLTAGATQTTTASYTPEAVLPDGAYTLYVQEFDAAGIWSASGSKTIVVDTTAPVLAQVTPVLPPTTSSQNPSYTFSSTEGGTITYGGGCSGSPAAVPFAGDNTITLMAVGGGPLGNGTYNTCTIIVTDAAGNPSTALTINPFMVDTDGQFLWVWLEGGGGYFLTIQEAYGAAENPDGLRARAAFLPEDITFGSNKNITLRGGYDPWYEWNNTGGYTTIRSLTIGGPDTDNGGVTIENIVIK